MFLVALIIAVVLGYLLKGSLRNINSTNIKGLYFVLVAVILEFITIRLLKNNYLSIGMLTYCLDFIMYVLLFVFVYLNRSNKWILMLGFGVLLNALVIFSNGGAMPVDMNAIRTLGFKGQVSSQGLYVELNDRTRFKLLADIIPITFPKPGVASIGDLLEVTGMALYIITEMKSKKPKINYMKIQQ